jgi:hypothetical protein
MIKLFIKFIIGVLSVPFAIGITVSFYNHIHLVKEIAGSLNYFAWGMVCYTALHLLFYKPTYLYVLGHETVHAGLSWIFGGKIKSFKVSEKGGSVGTDKTNVVVELGPYFVPLYAIIISLVYFVVASSYNVNTSVFVFLIGFALAFHLISTIEVLKIRQPDIVKSGYFFSIVLIYMLNIAVISVILGMLFESFATKKFFVDTWTASKDIYLRAVKQLFL